MKKSKITIALYKLSDANLQVKTEHIIQCLTNNEYFSTPSPPIAEVKVALKEFIDANAIALNRSKLDVSIKNDKRQALLFILKKLATYVQTEGEDNETALISSGFTLQKISEPIGVLPKPNNFKVSPTHPGAIKVSIDKVYGATMYLYEYRIKGKTAWQGITDTRTSTTFTNLNNVTEYEFRVVALGTNKDRIYTDILSSTVL